MVKSSHQNKFISRYTSLAVALQFVQTKRLCLLDPAKWQDRNDTQYLEAFCVLTSIKCVRALCFTSAPETSHHWQSFAAGFDGVRIDFHSERLSDDVRKDPALEFRAVEYRDINSAKHNASDVSILPFIKRLPYQPEQELRLLFKSREQAPPTYDLEISDGTVSRVVLSPTLPNALVNSVRDAVKAVSTFPGLRVYRSTLLQNETWLGPVKRAVEQQNRTKR